MNNAIERLPKWIRWILLLPLSMFSTFVVGLIIHLLFAHGAPIAYAGAFISGVAYVCVALTVAQIIAPSYKILVCVVLGVFILGDMTMTFLMMHSDLISDSFEPETSELSFLFELLRAKDFADVPFGSAVKLAGVVFGCLGMGVWVLRKGKAARPDPAL